MCLEGPLVTVKTALICCFFGTVDGGGGGGGRG